MGYPLETLQKTSKCKLIITVVIVGPLSRFTTWRIIPELVYKWIITIISKSPHWELFPFPSMAMNMAYNWAVTEVLRKNMILQALGIQSLTETEKQVRWWSTSILWGFVSVIFHIPNHYLTI